MSDRPVISICGGPTGKVSEYLEYILQPVMQESWSYIKDSGGSEKFPDATMVTKVVVDHYSSIIYKVASETLRKLNEHETSEIPTEDILQMSEFALKNVFF